MNSGRLAVVLLTAVVLAGCARLFPQHATLGKTKHPVLFIVTAETTPFYRYGPQQAQGPDRQLEKDTLVTVIRHAFGYSKVRLTDGQQGFVANDDLVRAPEKLVAAANEGDSQEESLPPPPEVKLPTADPELEPTPIPEPLMPQ